jgi:hypothetical protein
MAVTKLLNLFGFLAVSMSLAGCAGMGQPARIAANPLAPECKGRLALLRIDTITPNGTIDGVAKATQDQQAWYRANGYDDNDIHFVRLMKFDRATNSYRLAVNRVMILHVNPPSDVIDSHADVKRSAESNAAWSAFVKEYDDNSKVTAAFATCLPDSIR